MLAYNIEEKMNYDVLLNRTGRGYNQPQNSPDSSNHVSQQRITPNRPRPTRKSEGDTPSRKISSTIANPEEYASSPSSSAGSSRNRNDEIKNKVESKLMSMWNNVKYEWSGKIQTNFSKEQPVWLLGRCYHRKYTPVSSMESSMELTTSFDNKLTIIEPQVNLHSQSPIEELGTDAILETTSDVQFEDDGIDGFKKDFTSKVWMTYRKEFQTMNDSLYTSDCGWGCMLRSGQMMLAQALILHFLGRNWRWEDWKISTFEENLHHKIIRWFGDTPSKNTPFSIHKLVELGRESGKKPGDWYGPGAVAHLLKQAVRLAAQEISDLDGINVYVAQDCAVYIQDILDECTLEEAPVGAPWQRKHSQDNSLDTKSMHWKSLVLLVPLRLGAEKLNLMYGECLKNMLSLQCCIGIIGGRPKHSLYFMGFQEDKLIHLDPHYCQDFVDVNQENFDVSSFHCKSPRKLKLSKMDPCCCIGFYCRTRNDFDKFVVAMQGFLLPAKTYSERHPSTNSPSSYANYPMFIFCNGRSSEQQAELPQRMVYSVPLQDREDFQTDDDDETEEFVIL